ncbi:hypothetical protein P7K49_030896 [Saguinus oedipus]|uniref:Uncharacterized protein n=1 Tax=Saguinus oedipus TaxID=9490 RepID=A0ABQ9U5J0_SAGOE|nr:hypothetical protein P7K49_030896 [Saguinus oedipus]
MLDPSSSEEESDEIVEEESGKEVLGSAASGARLSPSRGGGAGAGAGLGAGGGGGSGASSGGGAGGLQPSSRAGGGRPSSPSPSVVSEKEKEELERLQKEEEERKKRLQLYVFVMRCIAYPFNAKQPTDMARRQQKVAAPGRRQAGGANNGSWRRSWLGGAGEVETAPWGKGYEAPFQRPGSPRPSSTQPGARLGPARAAERSAACPSLPAPERPALWPEKALLSCRAPSALQRTAAALNSGPALLGVRSAGGGAEVEGEKPRKAKLPVTLRRAPSSLCSGQLITD